MQKHKGMVLIFCLITLMILSVYALSAMEKSRLLHKQVAAYSHSKQLHFLTEVTLIQAVEKVNNADDNAWSEDVMSVNSASGWLSIKLPQPYDDVAQAEYYVQNLGVLKPSGNSPKVTSSNDSVLSSETYLFRITSKVHLYKIYSRIFEIDYVKIVYK